MKAKHLTTLFFLILGFSSFSQTPKETLDYLKTYYSELHVVSIGETRIDYSNILISDGKISGSFIITECAEYISEEGCTKYKNSTIECDKITGISLYYQPYKLVSETKYTKAEKTESWILDFHYADNQIKKLLLEYLYLSKLRMFYESTLSPMDLCGTCLSIHKGFVNSRKSFSTPPTCSIILL